MTSSAATIDRDTMGPTAYALEPAMTDADNAAAMMTKATQVLDKALDGRSAKDQWALLAAIEQQLLSRRVGVVQLAVHEAGGRETRGAQKQAAHELGARHHYVRTIISTYGPG